VGLPRSQSVANAAESRRPEPMARTGWLNACQFPLDPRAPAGQGIGGGFAPQTCQERIGIPVSNGMNLGRKTLEIQELP
jgi:hypothetical protein